MLPGIGPARRIPVWHSQHGTLTHVKTHGGPCAALHASHTTNLRTTECSDTAVHGMIHGMIHVGSVAGRGCSLQGWESVGFLTLWCVQAGGSRQRTRHRASGSRSTRGRLGRGTCSSASAPCHRPAAAEGLAEHPVIATEYDSVVWLNACCGHLAAGPAVFVRCLHPCARLIALFHVVAGNSSGAAAKADPLRPIQRGTQRIFASQMSSLEPMILLRSCRAPSARSDHTKQVCDPSGSGSPLFRP